MGNMVKRVLADLEETVHKVFSNENMGNLMSIYKYLHASYVHVYIFVNI